MRWEPDRSAPALPYTPPESFWTAVARGARNRCPVCGVGKVFAGYLKIVPACSNCGAPLGRLRADDAPPYFTIFIAGHLLVPPVLWIERAYMPPMWLHMVVWLPLFTVACILLLRPIKGATVGWMVKLGFTGAEHGGAETPREETRHGGAPPIQTGGAPPVHTGGAPPVRHGGEPPSGR